jgi:Na+:H+ antiporter, NhaA family
MNSITSLFGVVEHGAEPQWWLIALFAVQGLVIWAFAQKRYFVRIEGQLKPAFSEVQELSIFLLSGAVIAQFWVHGDPAGYAATFHEVLLRLPNVDVNLHFSVNDVFMVFFFGIAGIELTRAAMKPDGELRGKRGILPIAACAGGVLGPAIIYRMLCTEDLKGAWAVPCATDIAFAWLGARMIWGAGHPAVKFLLALAIADDFVGMIIIALFYPQRVGVPSFLLLIVAGMAIAYCMRRLAKRAEFFKHWLPYVLIPGTMCWIGLLYSGLHSALALVFVVPFMPMEGRDKGLFDMNNGNGHHPDTVKQFEHFFKPLVDCGLFFFGLANAGVAWIGTSAWDANSTAVLAGLGIGKLAGITALTVLAYFVLCAIGKKTDLPSNKHGKMEWRDVPVAGLLGGMGFTVALFVADAYGGHPSLKLGALASFAYLGLAVLIGKKFCKR